jgi:hypothetical protein
VASRKGAPPKRENTTDGEELNGNLCQFLLDLQPGTPSCNFDVGEVSSGKRGRNPQFGDGDGKSDALNHRQQRARKLKDKVGFLLPIQNCVLQYVSSTATFPFYYL